MAKIASPWMPTIRAVLFAPPALALVLLAGPALASEADLAIPDLHKGKLHDAWAGISAWNLLFYGALVIRGTLGISLYLLYQIKKLPAHKSMLDVAEIIFQTCKTYLIQQGKFLLMLFVLIAARHDVLLPRLRAHEADPRSPATSPADTLALVLLFSIVGMGGSYCGGLVRHPREHLRQLPAPRSPRSAASRGTWSTSRCGPACRSACS